MNPPGRAGEILSYIVRFQAEHGAPPTVREIGDRFGIRSTNGVSYYLDVLEKEGAIRRRRGRARGIELRADLISSPAEEETDNGIPILGGIAAGGPVVSEENLEGVLNTDHLNRGAPAFALRVTGDSMQDAGILNGDLVLVKAEPTPRNGDVVVAMIGEETTVKRFQRERGRVLLCPANEAYEPIPVTPRSPDLRILGKVVGVYRELR